MDKYLLNIVATRENLRLSMTSFLGSAHGPMAPWPHGALPDIASTTPGFLNTRKVYELLEQAGLEAVFISVVLSLSDWGNEKGGPPRIVQAMIAMTCEWYTRYTRLILLFFSQRHVETYPQLICKWTSPSLAMGQDRTPQNEKTWETIILDQVSITIHPDYTCSFNFIYMCLPASMYVPVFVAEHPVKLPALRLGFNGHGAKVLGGQGQLWSECLGFPLCVGGVPPKWLENKSWK